MGGFKKFLLGGDLVAVAVAFIMASTFAAVVAAFVTIIMDLIGKAFKLHGGFEKWAPGNVHIGAFIIAAITFVIVGAVVYFLVVLPYTKAKDRYFPDEAPGATSEELLAEIRDLLQAQNNTTP